MKQLELNGIIDENQEPWHIRIKRDDDSQTPRVWDDLGRFFVSPKQHYVSNEEDRLSMDDLCEHTYNVEQGLEWLKKKGYFALPISVYDHSGWNIYIGKKCGFDSSFIGFYVVNKEEWKKARMKKRVDCQKILEESKHHIVAFQNYIDGNVWWFDATRPGIGEEMEEEDSCGGFIADNVWDAIEDMRQHFPIEFKSKEEAIEYIKKHGEIEE